MTQLSAVGCAAKAMRAFHPIDNFADYILGLLWTMVGAHDKFRGIPRNCQVLDVPTGEIESTDFEIQPHHGETSGRRRRLWARPAPLHHNVLEAW
jgi:hypothetical protein